MKPKTKFEIVELNVIENEEVTSSLKFDKEQGDILFQVYLTKYGSDYLEGHIPPKETKELFLGLLEHYKKDKEFMTIVYKALCIDG